jgi:hypothetical protein
MTLRGTARSSRATPVAVDAAAGAFVHRARDVLISIAEADDFHRRASNLSGAYVADQLRLTKNLAKWVGPGR